MKSNLRSLPVRSLDEFTEAHMSRILDAIHDDPTLLYQLIERIGTDGTILPADAGLDLMNLIETEHERLMRADQRALGDNYANRERIPR